MQVIAGLLIVLLSIPFCLIAAVYDKGLGEYYIQEFGSSSPQDNPLAGQAHKIFNRLIEASEFGTDHNVRLIIVPSSAANWIGWAMCLPDGSIILVESILDLCFEGSSDPTPKGNARLAFILAHELSHLIDHHFTYLDHGGTKAGTTGTVQSDPDFRKKVEAGADYSGLILMTMSGFEPEHLIDESNFFLEYLKRVRRQVESESHYAPQKRKAVLTNSLRPIIEKLPLFANGVRFYQEKDYRQALEGFQQFATYFPGREVYNNIGLTYYQMALREQSKYDASGLFRFMLSTSVDTETLAFNLVPDELGKTRNYRNRHRELMDKAEYYLRQAMERDSSYIPARINLASAYISAEKYGEAVSLMKETLKKSPSKPEILNNIAVALYLSDPQNNFETALDFLGRIREEPTGYSFRFSRYNKARITSERLDCNDTAGLKAGEDCRKTVSKSWSPFLKTETDTSYSRLVRSELGYDRDQAAGTLEKQRLALVIGNGAYAEAPLLNPLNDATAVKKSLENLGFEVILGLDLNRFELLRIIEDFGHRLTPETTGLFYYSGHGMQVKGENFVLPINMNWQTSSPRAEVDQDEKIRNMAVSLNRVLDRMAEARNVQNIVILDACRDNPLPGLGSRFQGFAEMMAPPRTFIAYATSPGKLAWDGMDGNNGVFTSSFLRHLPETNLDIQDLFQEVRKEVAEKTGQFQTTWDVSTLEEGYYFNPAKPQDWTWHIVAGVTALLAGWQAREEARNYRQLADENELLEQKYRNATSLEDFIEIRQEYYVNQEKMKTHKRNYELLDIFTAAALIWEIYLVAFETYDEGIYDQPEFDLKPETAFSPNTQTIAIGISAQWRW